MNTNKQTLTFEEISDSQKKALGINPDRLGLITEKLQKEIAQGDYHSARMLVSYKGEVILNLTEGYSDYANKTALQPDAVFAHMSVTKQFTNILALTLVEKGLLKLHAPIAELIPEFAAFGKAKVNLFHLLTQTGGVTARIPSVPPEILMNIDNFVNWASSQPLETQPDEHVNYSSMVAHAVMAKLCLLVDGRGRTFSQMLHEDLFQPLGMQHTSMGVRPDLKERLVPIKAAFQGTDAPYPPERMEKFGKMIAMPESENPAGGTVGTIEDLHRFTEMLRRGGELNGTRILSPAMLSFCQQNFTGEKRNLLFDIFTQTRNWLTYPANIGLGFFLRGSGNLPGLFSVLNSANTFGGFGTGTTGFTIDPEKELSFTFLSGGLIEDSFHFERMGTLATMIIASIE